jgi:hypothetical protein
MKNAIITGLIIGVVSGVWMFVMRALGYSPQGGTIAPIEFVSGLIPLAGLYFGVKNFKENDCKGHMGFLEALLQCFKILLIGGVITTAAAIIYVEEIDGSNLMEFSGRIFGALLLGLLFALGTSVLLTSKPNKVD